MHSVTEELERQTEIALRDQFAGEILNAVASVDLIYNTAAHTALTKVIFKLADAMIEARKGGK
jgi:hypothetical protein